MVFSNRYELMRSQGIDPEWFYTTPEMEKKGLARADWVIAIHEKDAASFKALGLPQVVTIGHFARFPPLRASLLGTGSCLSVRKTLTT